VRNLRIAAVQFEGRSGDASYNLNTIRRLAERAANAGADVVSFHECSIHGYTFARDLSRQQLLEIAEPVPDGPSVRELIRIAADTGTTVLAGLFERTEQGDLYNTYLCVDRDGVRAKFRKIHPFISRYLTAGNEYVVFEIAGWKCGILICYDNNVIENVRSTALLGAEIIFMPHVTMCTPSTRPGAGFVDPKLWANRETDPTSLRSEFDGLKGRAWLMKWLPARAYDNGIYVVFTNPIGMDGEQLKNGCSMIVDPFGDIIAECRTLGDDIAIGNCVYDRIELSGGHRYREARRPELYRDIMSRDHTSHQKVAWIRNEE